MSVVVGGALHAQVKAGAAVAGVSMNEWLVEAIREKVTRDGDGVVSGDGCVAASGGGFDGVDPFGVGGGVGGVGSGDESDLLRMVLPPAMLVTQRVMDDSLRVFDAVAQERLGENVRAAVAARLGEAS